MQTEKTMTGTPVQPIVTLRIGDCVSWRPKTQGGIVWTIRIASDEVLAIAREKIAKKIWEKIE